MFALTSMVARAAQLNPRGMATCGPGRSVTWGDLPGTLARIAGGLQGLGIRDGERAAILSLNNDRYFHLYFAIPWAGGVFVPVNTRLAAPEILYWLDNSGARVLLVDEAFAELATEQRANMESVEHLVWIGEGEAPEGMVPWADIEGAEPVADARRGGDDLAGLLYTGGTTGRSKGVMLSHTNFVSNALQSAVAFETPQGARFLHAAPMFHVADFASCMNSTIVAGANWFLPQFTPDGVMTAIQEHRIERMLMVPTMINMLVNHPQVGDYDLSSLDQVLYGASPMPQAVIAKALEVLPGCGLAQAYGQTEAAPCITIMRPEYHTLDEHSPYAGKLRSAGRAVAGMEVAILDDDGAPVPLGEVGEICARGPNVMLGYRGLEEQTAEALRGGWLHTGDGGRMDEDGFVFVVDRVKDMIVSGGENVFSAEVENVLFQHPAVEQCAVIGIPHEQWGEQVHAIVVPKAGAEATEDDLISHCRDLIAGYKCPKSVEFRAEPLPLSGAGKILKTELRKPHWAGRERNVN